MQETFRISEGTGGSISCWFPRPALLIMDYGWEGLELSIELFLRICGRADRNVNCLGLWLAGPAGCVCDGARAGYRSLQGLQGCSQQCPLPGPYFSRTACRLWFGGGRSQVSCPLRISEAADRVSPAGSLCQQGCLETGWGGLEPGKGPF